MSINLPTKIVEKFSHVNLATNGKFTIDQRGDYSDFTSASEGDYICDCWKLSTKDPSSCYIKVENGVVFLKGVASTGDQIILQNRDTYDLGYYIHENMFDFFNITGTIFYLSFLTSFVDAIINIGKLKISTNPRYFSGFSNTQFDYSKTIYTKNEAKLITASNCKTTAYENFDQRASITIDFLDNGEFDIEIFSFREIPGKYQTPPKYESMTDTTNLQRCRKYYQSGYDWCVKNFAVFGSLYSYRSQIPLTPKMASTPTVSTTYSYAQLQKSVPDGSSQVFDPPGGNWSINADAHTSYIVLVYIYIPGYTGYNMCRSRSYWTAEIL